MLNIFDDDVTAPTVPNEDKVGGGDGGGAGLEVDCRAEVVGVGVGGLSE